MTTQASDVQVVVVVYSRFGVLERLCQQIIDGVRSVSGAGPHLIEVAAYYGSMASPVKRFFEDVLTAGTSPPIDRTGVVSWRFIPF